MHFELSFLRGAISVSRLILVDVQLFYHHLLKILYLLHGIAYVALSKIVDYIHMGLFLGSLCVPLIYFCILCEYYGLLWWLR